MFWQKMQSNLHRLSQFPRLPQFPFACPASWTSFAFALSVFTLFLLCLSRHERDWPPLSSPSRGVAPLHFELHANFGVDVVVLHRHRCRLRWAVCLSLSLVSWGGINSPASSPPPTPTFRYTHGILKYFLSYMQIRIHCERREQNTTPCERYVCIYLRICWYYLHKWWTSWFPY